MSPVAESQSVELPLSANQDVSYRSDEDEQGVFMIKTLSIPDEVPQCREIFLNNQVFIHTTHRSVLLFV